MNFANFGTVQVDLFDDLVSTTVNNFLTNYVATGRYSNTMIHRSVSNFVIQGGGFEADDGAAIATNPPIALDYIRANTRGTIAMARTGDGGNPNATTTATSQWFINTADNSTSLAPAPGNAALHIPERFGYAVFGSVVGPGMSVVDSIAAVPKYNYSDNLNDAQRTPKSQEERDALTAFAQAWGLQNRNTFNEWPLQNFTATDFSGGVNPLPHDVVLNFITVVKTHPSYQNPYLATDVNNDGFLRSSDVATVNFDLLHNGFHNLTSPFAGTSYLDVDGNGRVNLADSRLVINSLLLHGPGPGPQVSPLASPAMSIMSVPEPSSLVLGAMAAFALGGFALRARIARRRQTSTLG